MNTWGELSVDEKRGIGYFPLGSPAYDFYGGDRHGANLFGDSIIALDLRTGKRIWHFQMVHHDLWDYDPTTGPKLLTVKHDGKMVDIVAQPTKMGFVYVFERVTGEPLWPIEERPVPKSDVPGEQSWPTQPFPTKPPPFVRQKFTVEDLNPHLDPSEAAKYREMLAGARHEGMFTPPGLDRFTVVVPGDSGGANWGSTAADPSSGTLYIKGHNAPNFQRLAERLPSRPFVGGTIEQQGGILYNERCSTCHGPDRSGVALPKTIGMDRFKTIITKGQSSMPPITDLTEQNLTALAAYIDNPAAGVLPPGRGGRGGPPMPPPPPGQVRFFGRFNNQQFASDGQPVFSPPWTTLTAMDLNEGTIKWQVPLATSTTLAAKGLRGRARPAPVEEDR